MAVNLSDTNIDPHHPFYHPLLDDLQGNVLKSHGRNYSVHLFLRFSGTAEEARQWISNFADKYVTSAIEQYHTSVQYKKNPEKYGNRLFANFLLTANGYRTLGYSEKELPEDARFRLGMKHPDVRAWLHDNPSDEWAPEFQNEIHALIILANQLDPNQDNKFSETVDDIKLEIGEVADVVAIEYGHVKRRENGDAIEQFGYVDGLSQPLFYNYDIENAKATAGRGLWDPSAPLKLVLAKDPLGKYQDSYGSYIVYRKYYQDVDRFHTMVEELADKGDMDKGFAGASVIGRFTDGTPLVMSKKPLREGANSDAAVPNNFTYDWDAKGKKCPFHAHIRKTNPRGEKHDEPFTRFLRFFGQFKWIRRIFPKLDKAVREMDKMERSRRIARRGITYGPVARESGEEVGLLFLCAQADIARQFEFIQAAWANKNTFLKDATGIDPVIGQGYQQDGGQHWPVSWKASETVNYDFSRVIEMRGGEYFFLPSISSLLHMSK